jgi:regulator of sigma E protease
MLISILAFVFVLGVLVIIHEAGHFAVARLLGAPVDVFSVGFGKRIWGFERGGTDYRLSLVPLGGYVRIIGLGPDESDVIGEGAEATELLPRWKRALILLAGPLTNIFAAVVFVALAFMMGVETYAYREQAPVVGWVEPGSPAEDADLRPGDLVQAVNGEAVEVWRSVEMAVLTAGRGELVLTVERSGNTLEISMTTRQDSRFGYDFAGIGPRLEAIVRPSPGPSPAAAAGLQEGDRILAINDEPVDQYYDLPRLVGARPSEELILEIDRQGQRLSLPVVTRDEGGVGKIGVQPILPTVAQRLAPVPAFRAAVVDTRRITHETFRVIGRLLTRKVSIRQVSGPIGIAQISGEAARSGFQSLIWLMGLISLQLGIFNLLPIPILDGGHLTIIGFESIIRRDLSLKVKERILEIGFYLLIVLMVVVLFNDMVKILPENVYRFFFRG